MAMISSIHLFKEDPDLLMQLDTCKGYFQNSGMTAMYFHFIFEQPLIN